MKRLIIARFGKMKRLIIAWIKKLLGIHSPSGALLGYDYEFDYLKAKKMQARSRARQIAGAMTEQRGRDAE